jgi:hypothetical protein
MRSVSFVYSISETGVKILLTAINGVSFDGSESFPGF